MSYKRHHRIGIASRRRLPLTLRMVREQTYLIVMIEVIIPLLVEEEGMMVENKVVTITRRRS